MAQPDNASEREIMMKKLVSFVILILLIFSAASVSVAASDNPNKALAALTANTLNANWSYIEYSWPGQYTKGGVQSQIVTMMNEVKHEYGYEKEPYEQWQVNRIIAYLGLGLSDNND